MDDWGYPHLRKPPIDLYVIADDESYTHPTFAEIPVHTQLRHTNISPKFTPFFFCFISICVELLLLKSFQSYGLKASPSWALDIPYIKFMGFHGVPSLLNLLQIKFCSETSLCYGLSLKNNWDNSPIDYSLELIVSVLVYDTYINQHQMHILPPPNRTNRLPNILIIR